MQCTLYKLYKRHTAVLLYLGVLSREEDRRADVRASLQRAREGVTREAQTLLDLRLRELVTDDVFVARRQDIEERQRGLEARLVAPERSQREIIELTKKTLTFATRAAATFATGTLVQRRMILAAVGLNYTLGARKVAVSLKKPFALLSESAACHDWWAQRDLNPRPFA